MAQEFFKFPTTPHLVALPGTNVRQSKLMTESAHTDFLQHELIVEEKIDGANLGISFDLEGNAQVQNRGEYLYPPWTGQWKKLQEWLTPKLDTMFECLENRYILFGEWCYAEHSVAYKHLPDWFVGFDLYDRQAERFLATARRDETFSKLGIAKAPEIARGRFTCHELKGLMSASQFSDQPAEGIYLRYDDGDYLGGRAKIVRAEFVRAIEEHWSRSAITPNQLSPERHHLT